MKYSDFKDIKISKLGFGMMRLPLGADGAIDEAQVCEMVDLALARGVNYFDTAYPYHGGMSEIVAGHALNRHAREKFMLASKYPGHQYADVYDPAEVFETQLKKCGVEYFDFYLLHNVCESSIGVYEDARWGIVDYFLEQRRLGRVRHLGFSSHAEYETLKRFLDRYGAEMEFCQIQLNYLDWTLQNAKARYEMLTERGIPVWVMEPVRGGRLAKLSEDQVARMAAFRPEASAASWAFRWLMGLENVKVILSGMSDMAQMRDNLATFESERQLSESEAGLLREIAGELQAMIPCTGCRYCCDGCPQGLDIPMLLSSLNDVRFSPSITTGMRMEALGAEKLPTACIGCGACAQICPQHIDVPALMAEFSERLSGLPSWKKICEERAEAARRLKS
ncbi:MAG: aldo/keto reductase [Proteobacteria bacterium]|nr:aldo/keto reductase [Pseudomonadota bacterium]